MKLNKFLLIISVSLLFGIASVSSAREISRGEIPSDLVQWLIDDLGKAFHMSSEEMEDLNQNLKSELHDLNGDGVAEFLLHIESHFWCGAGTNCHYWVVQKARKGYKVLLEDMRIHVGDTVSNGYRDLISEESMGSDMEVIYKRGKPVRVYRHVDAIRVYKYDGKNYQLRRSYDKFTPHK